MSISIQQISITDLGTDCVVNAANSQLTAGSGVCGAIFQAAGYDKLEKACDAIGYCPTGGAVITPGFALKAKYIVHAVGPIWKGGWDNEQQNLYNCYQEALNRAVESGCHSIGFPLISAGVFGYPKEDAWRTALRSCQDWLDTHSDYPMEVVFAVLDGRILALGRETLDQLMINPSAPIVRTKNFVFFWKLGEQNEWFANWYPCRFTLEGIRYVSTEQYMMAKKALLFNDLDIYRKIMATDDPEEAKALGKLVQGFVPAVWNACKREIVFNGNRAKFTQDKNLAAVLLQTGVCTLAEASPYDKIWGIGLSADDPAALNPSQWKGENLLGSILMEIREQLKEAL